MSVQMKKAAAVVDDIEPWKLELADWVERTYDTLPGSAETLPAFVVRHLRRLAPDAARYEAARPGSSPSLRAARRAVDAAILGTFLYASDPPPGLLRHIPLKDLEDVVAQQPDVIADEAIVAIRACLSRGALVLATDGIQVLNQNH